MRKKTHDLGTYFAFVSQYATAKATKQAYAGTKQPNVGFIDHVSFAKANDGVIFRNLNSGTRWFISDSGKWQGQVGVSGKVRAMLEIAYPNVTFEWQQQGSKNYYYTPQVEMVVNELSK
jgi:hypothetical protein